MSIRKLAFPAVLILFSLSGCDDEKNTPDTRQPLFTFEVSDDYENDGFDRLLFISDINGDTVESWDVSNNQSFTMQTPVGHTEGDTYTLTIARYREILPSPTLINKEYILESYAEVKPGAYLLDIEVSSSSEVGSHKLVVQNAPLTPYGFGRFGNGYHEGAYAGTIFNGSALELLAPLIKQPVDLYYFAYPADGDNSVAPVYKRFPSAFAGETVTTDFSTFIPMENKKIISLPEAESSFYVLSGIPSPGNYTNKVSFYVFFQDEDESPKNLNIYYPNHPFPELYTILSYQNENSTYQYHSAGLHPPETFKKIDCNIAGFNYANRNFSIQTTGTADFLSSAAGHSISSTAHNIFYSWHVTMPVKPSVSFTLPSIPKRITNRYPSLAAQTFVFKSAGVSQCSSVADYNEVIKKTFGTYENIRNASREVLEKYTVFD